jgi:uncharacterized membrane protein
MNSEIAIPVGEEEEMNDVLLYGFGIVWIVSLFLIIDSIRVLEGRADRSNTAETAWAQIVFGISLFLAIIGCLGTSICFTIAHQCMATWLSIGKAIGLWIVGLIVTFIVIIVAYYVMTKCVDRILRVSDIS